MKNIRFTPSGVCSRAIDIALDDNGIVQDIVFTGGCAGNAKGVSALCKGRRAEDLIAVLKGIRCGAKKTSCPDQLSLALENAIKG